MRSRPPQPLTPRPPPRSIGRGGAPIRTPASAPAVAGGGVTLKRMVWTGAFAAVTVVGAIYGAGLKTKQEYQTEKKQFVEASVEERVAVLEQRRSALVAQRIPLESKLAQLRARMKAKEVQEAERNGE